MTQDAELQELRRSIGERLARKLFENRGNHSEMHLSESELSEIIIAAIQWADKTRTAEADQGEREK